MPSSLLSLFHRRLLLLGLVLALAAIIPGFRLIHLTLARGGELRERAERRLQVERLIPTTRGRILDRHGRVLATDLPSYDIAIDYAVITGQWAFTQAARHARKAHADRWPELSPVEREALVQDQVPLFQAQLQDGWATLSRVSGVPIEEIEARKNEIIRTVQLAQAVVAETERQRQERQRREDALARGEALALDEAEVLGPAPAKPRALPQIREQTIPHVILRGVRDQTAFAFITLAEGTADGGTPAIPGLHVVDATTRAYPGDQAEVTLDRALFPGPLRSQTPITLVMDGVASHVVGNMRATVFPEDLGSRLQERLDTPGTLPDGTPDMGFYRAGDTVGATGMEASAEPVLRGLRGSNREELDTGAVVRTPHEPGKDVRLTLDAALQARVQALLDPRAGLTTVQPWHRNLTVSVGQPLAGAAVVLDVDTGEILALVSSPSPRRDAQATVDTVYDDPLMTPFRNRAVAEAYPPGSIVKPLIYVAAVAEKAIDAYLRIECTGALYPNQPNRLRCWTQKAFQTTHNIQLGHDPDASDALMGSCNIYFYHLGRTLGPERMIDWFNRFGVGRSMLDGREVVHPRLGVGLQYDGAAGDRKGVSATSLDEATLMGIGQGPIAWTPLHAVDAYATLARGGIRILPRLREDTAPETVDLRLDPRSIPIALDGLRRAVSDEKGTGHHITFEGDDGLSHRENIFTVPGVAVWGKSGTADAPRTYARSLEHDPDDEDAPLQSKKQLDAQGQPVVLRAGDHSWFVGMAGPAGAGRPRYAIAVVIEYGGSGGRVAGPIANLIMAALVEENYLPRETPREASAASGASDSSGAPR